MSDAWATSPYSPLRRKEMSLFNELDHACGLSEPLDNSEDFMDEWVQVAFDQWNEILAPLDEHFFQWAWAW